jgi:hypothetical protein
VSTCSSGHPIRGPQDLRSNRQCARCSRDNEARYRQRLRNARDQIRAGKESMTDEEFVARWKAAAEAVKTPPDPADAAKAFGAMIQAQLSKGDQLP